MIELSVIRDLVAIFGVLAGFTYYVMTVQSQRKSQKLNSLHNWFASHQDRDFAWYWEEVTCWEWVDYDDFQEKYWSDPETASKFYTVINYYEGVGYLWKTGVLDLDEYGVRWFGPWCLRTYWKFKPIIDEFRVRTFSDWMRNWEELAVELESLLGDNMNPEWVQRIKPNSS